MKEKVKLHSDKKDISYFINELEKAGNIYLVGNWLRDIIEEKDTTIKIDIVISVTDYNHFCKLLNKYMISQINFEGYKLKYGRQEIDVWLIDKIWGYDYGYVESEKKDYIKNYWKTTFLNIDSLIYDVKNNILYDKGYKEAIEKKEINVILPQSPCIMKDIEKAFSFSKKYGFKIADKLKEIIKTEIRKRGKDNFFKELEKIQIEKYFYVLNTKDEILDILNMQQAFSF